MGVATGSGFVPADPILAGTMLTASVPRQPHRWPAIEWMKVRLIHVNACPPQRGVAFAGILWGGLSCRK
jgi:hypothetical protein